MKNRGMQKAGLRYIVAFGLALLALLVRWLLRGSVDAFLPFAIFFLAVTASALFGGFGPGLLTTLVITGFGTWFVLPPFDAFTIDAPRSRFGALVFLGEGLIISILGGALFLRRQRSQQDLETIRRADRALTYRLQMEHLVGRISTQLLDQAPEEIDRTIKQALAEVGAFAEVDRAYLFLIAEDGTMLKHTQEWCAPGIEPYIDQLPAVPAADIPWWMAQLRQHKAIYVPDIASLPPEAAAERALLESQHIQSLLVVPLVAHQALLGFVGFDAVRVIKRWTDDDIALLRLAGEIFANALHRRSTAEALQRSEAELRAILAASTDLIIMLDADGRYLKVPRANEALLYSPAAELIGKTIYDTFPPEQAAGFHDMIRQALATQQPTELEYSLPIRGREIWFAATVAPMNARTVIFFARDITRRREAEDNVQFLADASTALSGSLDIPTILFELSHLVVPRVADWCVVYLLSSDGDIDRVVSCHRDNGRAILLGAVERDYPAPVNAPYGYRRVIREGRSELLSDIDDAFLQRIARDDEHLSRLRALGLRSQLSVPLLARGQLLGAVTMCMGDSGRGFGPADSHLAEDLAQRAALAIENAQLYADAQQAIAARDEFLSIAAHELRTPLTAMVGFAQVLEERALRSGNVSERDMRALRVMNDQGERLERLIDTLLELGRIETGKFRLNLEPLDLVPLVRRVVDGVQPIIERHVVRLIEPGDPVIVLGDEQRLEQVFQNLLQNALKYSPDGGEITWRLGSADGRACVTVTDQGIGIPELAIPRLFDRFYRASNAEPVTTKGMGIGLYVVKEIITMHDGDVDVQSVEGQGSTFTVRLPLLPMMPGTPLPVLARDGAAER